MSMSTFDPFAALRAMENGHSAADTTDTAAEADLFSGSEPLDSSGIGSATTDTAATAAVVEQLPIYHLTTPTPSAAAAAAAIQMTSEAALREALLILEERVIRLERLALRNGWSL